MSPEKIKLFALAILVAGFASIVSVRGFGWRLGAQPAALHSEYPDEESWIVNEIVHDIEEMSAYGRNHSANAGEARAERVSPGTYRVSAKGMVKGDLALDLTSRVWDPAQFTPVAHAMLGDPQTAPRAPILQVHQRLTHLTALELAGASADVSAALARQMDDPSLHEAAALTIGAFGLRESSWRFNDVRWALNRMTAHLAMARALAPGRPFDLDGRIAESILLTLANHGAAATSALDALDGEKNPDAAPWTKALRMRMTQDWQLLAQPATALLLEKLEYFRAAARRPCGRARLLISTRSTSIPVRRPTGSEFFRRTPTASKKAT